MLLAVRLAGVPEEIIKVSIFSGSAGKAMTGLGALAVLAVSAWTTRHD